MTKAIEHEPTVCFGAQPLDGNVWYGSSGRSFRAGSSARHCGGWVVNLRCPDCGREAVFGENYLGKEGRVICDGRRFIRPHKQTLSMLVKAIDRGERLAAKNISPTPEEANPPCQKEEILTPN